jgi:hypothetical protein
VPKVHLFRSPCTVLDFSNDSRTLDRDILSACMSSTIVLHPERCLRVQIPFWAMPTTTPPEQRRSELYRACTATPDDTPSNSETSTRTTFVAYMHLYAKILPSQFDP